MALACSAPLLRAQAPDAAALKAQVQSLGLTPDQLRQRLSAAGFSPDLLDSYLNGAGQGASPRSASQAQIAAALDALQKGVAQERDLASQQTQVRTPAAATAPITIDSVPVFGLEIFRRTTTQFEPAVAGPADEDYRLGAGDVLSVFVTGRIDLAYTLEVTRDGLIVIPTAGQVPVANLTLGQATSLIERRLSATHGGIGTAAGSPARLYVSVARLRTNQVFVLGDVLTPGSYQVAATGSMLAALYAAGGPSVNGSLRGIELRRNGRTVATLDLYDYLLRGDASHDARLQQGDVLFVPRVDRRVLVQGEVMRPAWYEARQGEAVATVLAAAGGWKSTAARDRVLVQRILPEQARANGNERAAFDVRGTQVSVFPLEDGDRLTVFRVSERVRGQLSVGGHVARPGPQGNAAGRRLSEVLTAAGGVLPGAYSDEVTIVRTRADSTREQLVARLDPQTLQPVSDLVMQEDDSVHVFSRAEFRPRMVVGADTMQRRRVRVGGAVLRPGTLEWISGLTLRQAILRSGGIDEGASLKEVEVARMPQTREQGTQAEIIRVQIDSSYLFDRAPSGAYDGPPGEATRAAGTREFILRPYDVVNVLRQPDFEYLGTVTLQGEVRFPGQYAIAKKGERLRDLIERAGGLTRDANPDAAVFRRRLTIAERAERERTLRQMRLGAATSTAASTTGSDAIVPSGAAQQYRSAVDDFLQLSGDSADRVSVDLPSALRGTRQRDNIEVRPGDVLTVPLLNPVVTIIGFVQSPASVPHVPGVSLREYVERAGGPTPSGAAKNAYVIQPNGAVESLRTHWWLIPDSDPVPRPGATVVVPQRDLGDRKQTVAQQVGPLLQMVASLFAIIAVVKR